MKYSIEYSPLAVEDLQRVRSEVLLASSNADVTKDYLLSLMSKIESKSDFPMSGHPIFYGDKFTGYYFVRYKAYLAFYRVDGERLLVDRILFGKSDYLQILFPLSDND